MSSAAKAVWVSFGWESLTKSDISRIQSRGTELKSSIDSANVLNFICIFILSCLTTPYALYAVYIVVSPIVKELVVITFLTFQIVSFIEVDLISLLTPGCSLPSISYIPETSTKCTSSPSSRLCFDPSNNSTRPFSSQLIDLILQEVSSSPFLSKTSKLSPKSLKRRPNTPTTSVQMNFLPCLWQKLLTATIVLLVASVSMTIS